MGIKRFIYGESSKLDHDMIQLIGVFLLDKKVHDKLGVAPTCLEGDIWLISETPKGKVKGFLSARISKNKKMHMRLVYEPGDGESVMKSLSKKAIELAKQEGCSEVWINEKKDSKYLKELGFSCIPKSIGVFRKWALEIGE